MQMLRSESSVAVCLWEIFSLGGMPYEGYSNKELARRIVEEEMRLEKPSRCSDMIYELMLECWSLNPEDRPTFKEIYERMITSNMEVLSSHEDAVYRKQFGNLTPSQPRNSKRKFSTQASIIVPSPHPEPKDPKISFAKNSSLKQPNATTSEPNLNSQKGKERRRESNEEGFKKTFKSSPLANEIVIPQTTSGDTEYSNATEDSNEGSRPPNYEN